MSKPLILWLVVMFCVFVYFHFWGLASQEFIGDEAAIMLNIDVALDSITTGNISFLAYPFLWHHEPLRAVIEGTILHFFGVNPVLLRLPNILFDLSTFWVLVYVFVHEKVNHKIIAASMFAYSMGAFLMIGRMALTDGWTRLFLLLIAYLCHLSIKEKNVRKLELSSILFVLSLVRVLDTAIMLVPILWAGWKIRAWENQKFFKTSVLLLIVLIVYFSLWGILPYAAFRMGLIENYRTNGLFYYLNRASDASGRDFSYNFQILSHYSSGVFAAWILGTFASVLFISKIRKMLFVSLPPLIAIYSLFEPSIHITSYIGIFFWQAVTAVDYVGKKHQILKPAVVVGILMIGLMNLQQLKISFWNGRITNESKFVWGHVDVPRPGYDLDEAVKRIYQRHGVDPGERIRSRSERWGK